MAMPSPVRAMSRRNGGILLNSGNKPADMPSTAVTPKLSYSDELAMKELPLMRLLERLVRGRGNDTNCTAEAGRLNERFDILYRKVARPTGDASISIPDHIVASACKN